MGRRVRGHLSTAVPAPKGAGTEQQACGEHLQAHGHRTAQLGTPSLPQGGISTLILGLGGALNFLRAAKIYPTQTPKIHALDPDHSTPDPNRGLVSRENLYSTADQAPGPCLAPWAIICQSLIWPGRGTVSTNMPVTGRFLSLQEGYPQKYWRDGNNQGESLKETNRSEGSLVPSWQDGRLQSLLCGAPLVCSSDLTTCCAVHRRPRNSSTSQAVAPVLQGPQSQRVKRRKPRVPGQREGHPRTQAHGAASTQGPTSRAAGTAVLRAQNTAFTKAFQESISSPLGGLGPSSGGPLCLLAMSTAPTFANIFSEVFPNTSSPIQQQESSKMPAPHFATLSKVSAEHCATMEQAAGQGGRHSHSPHLLRATGSAVLVSYIKKTLQIETSLCMMF